MLSAKDISTSLKISTNLKGSVLGVVSNCTLFGTVKKINVDGRSYCVIEGHQNTQIKGQEICTNLNARLPLPKSYKEFLAFYDNFPPTTGKNHWIHIDLRRPPKVTDKTKWLTVDNKDIGSRFVYWQPGYPKKVDYHTKAAFNGHSGYVISVPDGYRARVLCVQEIVSGKSFKGDMTIYRFYDQP